ncbi:hypothetical protein R1flu_009247 [Riccia fluitans]|uniref:Thaumatin-like protein n=1 Tax=Riccia fluitans TaxID=41844 RepID=A0ABD1Z2D6_9MARC
MRLLMVNILGMVLIACTWFTVDGCRITIRNKCYYHITACVQEGSKSDIAQHELPVGGSTFVDFGFGCSWTAGVVYASVQGRCALDGFPKAATDRNFANLAEFTIGSKDGTDYYDLSNVNAYSHPLAIRPVAIAHGEIPKGKRCGSPTCSISDIWATCQSNNRLHTFPTGAVSCINTDGTAGFGPTSGTRLFKRACADAYSYNFDDATSTFICGTGTSYDVIFCP